MAKIRIAQKSNIYTLMLVLSATFIVIGIVFNVKRLKDNYLDPQVPQIPVAEKMANDAAGIDEDVVE